MTEAKAAVGVDEYEATLFYAYQRRGDCPDLWHEEQPLLTVPGAKERILYYKGVAHTYTGHPTREKESSKAAVAAATIVTATAKQRIQLSSSSLFTWRRLVDRCGDSRNCVLCCKACRRDTESKGPNCAKCRAAFKELEKAERAAGLAQIEDDRDRRTGYETKRRAASAVYESKRAEHNRIRNQAHSVVQARRRQAWYASGKTLPGYHCPWPEDKALKAQAPADPARVTDNSSVEASFTYSFSGNNLKRKAETDVDVLLANKKPRLGEALFNFS